MFSRIVLCAVTLLFFSARVRSLGLSPIQPPANPAEEKYFRDLSAATELANLHIDDMHAVLNAPNQPNNRKYIEATFGKDPTMDLAFTQNAVAQLRTANVPIMLIPAQGAKVLAFTYYDDSVNPMKPLHVEFGKAFWKKSTSVAARAATLIHEATHFQVDTGDYIVNDEFLHGSNPATSHRTGYTSSLEPYKTVEALNKDTKWTRMRDGFKPTFGPAIPPVKKMHLNAESYAQLSSIAGHAVGHFVPESSEAVLVVQDRY
ncbi:hypothetical protein CPC08DRAFT_710689 [Agrocybe pediades]|nr:hypothetical protein CPC08DRAFT_710689 [Agrocybe pediades]